MKVRWIDVHSPDIPDNGEIMFIYGREDDLQYRLITFNNISYGLIHIKNQDWKDELLNDWCCHFGPSMDEVDWNVTYMLTEKGQISTPVHGRKAVIKNIKSIIDNMDGQNNKKEMKYCLLI